jgi:hypothetical protein
MAAELASNPATPDDPTLIPRRNARFTHMRKRAEAIAAGAPRFTPEQFNQLAEIFAAEARRPAGDDR